MAKAREAAGHKFRTTFARAAGIKSVRSLEMLEAGEPGVGQSVLFAVGRALPNWDEGTPRVILEGGPIPRTTPAQPEPAPTPRYPAGLLDDMERGLWDLGKERKADEEDVWPLIWQWRVRKEALRSQQQPPLQSPGDSTQVEQGGSAV